jgi:hypothetical protein
MLVRLVPSLRRLAAVALVFALAFALVACGKNAPAGQFYGVRHGMSARDTRAAFTPPATGNWSITQGELTLLDWTGTTPMPPSSVASVRFEFHNGMLVAVRATLSERDPHAAGPLVEDAGAIVTLREREGDRVRYVSIARDCPAHKDEVAKILARAPK